MPLLENTSDDPSILAWTTDNNCIVAIYDRVTKTDVTYQRSQSNEMMLRLFVVSDNDAACF